MSIVEQLTADATDHELRRAVQRAVEAERDDEPMQNGKQRNVEVSKNTHFEFPLGGDGDPEAYIYVERYDTEPGIEVMVWADNAWFDEAFEGYGPNIEDGGDRLATFADTLIDAVADEMDTDHKPSFEYVQRAPPSVVFTAVFYLDE